MSIPPVSEPYEQTVGMFARMLRTATGPAPSDPAKVAQVVVTLASRDDAPVRLLLGADAVQLGADAAKALAESDAKWREMSLSTRAVRADA